VCSSDLFAEELAREKWFQQISVISGIGVREYYLKQGYLLAGTYVKKSLDVSR
jgi:elongator complex protein 3